MYTVKYYVLGLEDTGVAWKLAYCSYNCLEAEKAFCLDLQHGTVALICICPLGHSGVGGERVPSALVISS